MTTQKTTPAVYVASLTDYNNGDLVGKWFDLTDYSSNSEVVEAIQDYFKELDKDQPLSGGEVREEWAIHDFEGFPKSLYSEYMGFDEFYEFWNVVSELDEERAEAFEIFCNNSGEEMNADTLEKFEEAYQGYYSGFNPEMDFTYQLVDDCYNLEQMMGSLSNYFDYEAFSRDLFMSDYWQEGGHVFRNI